MNLRVGGAEVDADGNVFVALVNLNKGPNVIPVVAETSAGERARKTLEVTYKPLPEADSAPQPRTSQTLSDSVTAQETNPSSLTISVNATQDAVDANPGDGLCESAASNGTCTLRAAVQETNAVPGKDTIEVPDGNYALTLPGRDENAAVTGDLDLTDVAGVSITGSGRDSTIIDGGQLDRVMEARSLADMEISKITITGGQAERTPSNDVQDPNYDHGNGGGILARNSNLTLVDVVVRNNIAVEEGGGISQGRISRTQTSNSRLSISGSLITENSAEVGGGIRRDPDAYLVQPFELRDSTVSNNTAIDGIGGGIYNSWGGSLAITRSIIDGNTAVGYRGSGGGISNDATPLTVEDSRISNNSSGWGAGIVNWAFSDPDTFRVIRSIVSGNRCVGPTGPCEDGSGGGIAYFDSPESDVFVVRDSFIENNTTANNGGGGLYAEGCSFEDDDRFEIIGSTIRGNSVTGSHGGGLMAYCNSGITIKDSTVSNNEARFSNDSGRGGAGGGLYLHGLANIVNTTISGNHADGDDGWITATGEAAGGGGILAFSELRLANVTLTDNGAPTGSNLFADGEVKPTATIIANGEGSAGCFYDDYGSVISKGNNLDSGDSCGFDQSTDLTNTDPLLKPLAENGGLTKTHALLSGSPAIDAGGNFCPPTDQRGVERMHDGDDNGLSTCDIGAYEKQGSSPPISPATGKFQVQASVPESLSVVDGALAPNPFTVSATVRFEGYAPAENASVTLSTSPEGLSVEGDPAVSLGTMNPGEERQVNWRVRASGRRTGRVYDLSVEASAAGVSAETASRQVSVPPLSARPDPPPGEGDDQGQCVDPNACGDDPINFVTGNVYEYREDLYVPGRGVPVRFVRFYNSRDPYDGPLGSGWTHSYDASLEENADGLVEEMDPQGKRLVYTKNPDGSYSAPKGFHDTLTKNPDGTFTLVRKGSRDEWLFDAEGALAEISDKDGNALIFSHDAQDRLAGITDSAGRLTSLEYDAAGRISTLTDPAGNVTRYTYEAGNLTSVTDPLGNAIRYEYDAGHNLTRITDKTGGAFLFSYDEQDRAISARADDGTWAATLAYDEANNKTTVTDSKDGRSVFHYNEMSRITKLEQPDGTVLDYTFDPDGNRASRTDANAATARAVYDADGNPTEVTTSGGATTRTTYDENNNPTSVTDALGNVTRYTYDERGNLIEETDPLGNETTYTYDDHGQLIETTKPNGKTNPDGTPGTATTYEYDAQGNRTSETNALGNKTTYTYDAMGRLTSTTDARGNVTKYEHDALGRVTKVTNPDLTTVLTKYDAAGNPVETTDEAGRVSRTAYDARGNPTSITDPAGNLTRYQYDTEGNLASETDALGARTTYEYDALGRKTKETKPDGTTNPDGTPGTVVTSYAYDAAGNLVSKTDPLGRITRMSYDAAGRLTQVTDPGGGIATYEYDVLGRRTKATNPNGHATTYEYDAMGRLTREMDPLLNATVYSYDAAGNQKSRTDAAGRRTEYTYDAMNRLTATAYPNGAKVQSTYDAVGNLTSISDETGLYSYAYDARNRPTSETWPGGRIIKHEYDAAGNRTALVHPDGKKVLYSYDAAGRMASLTDRGGARTTYAYDALGRPARVSYPSGAGETYAYDPLGRVTRATATGANTTGGTTNLARLTYAYDKGSNPISITDKAGEKSTFTYDVLDRLTREAYPDRTLTYAYDAAGNRKTMTSDTPTTSPVTTSYTYDAAERMTKAGSATYAYDKIGNLTSKTVGATTTPYRYDYESMMTKAGTKTYERDPLGRAISATSGTNTTSYLFDGQQVIEEKTGTAAPAYYARGLDQQLISRRAGTGAPSYYHQDAIGSVTALTNNSGAITDTYAYTAFGGVRKRTGTSAQPFQFLSSAYDPTTKLSDFHARMYDPAVGRFLTEDLVKGLPTLTQTMNPYSCSANNPLRYPDPSGMLGDGMMEDDPLMPNGGDSFHNVRAQKNVPDTGGTELPPSDAAPCRGENGVYAISETPPVTRIYLDSCQTRDLLYLMTLGGVSLPFVALIPGVGPPIALVYGALLGIGGLEISRQNTIGGGEGVYIEAVYGPDGEAIQDIGYQ